MNKRREVRAARKRPTKRESKKTGKGKKSVCYG